MSWTHEALSVWQSAPHTSTGCVTWPERPPPHIWHSGRRWDFHCSTNLAKAGRIMKGEFLLEIGTEEIPASLFRRQWSPFAIFSGRLLDNARISYSSQETYATPRRLIFRVLGVDLCSPRCKLKRTVLHMPLHRRGTGIPPKLQKGSPRVKGGRCERLADCEHPERRAGGSPQE